MFRNLFKVVLNRSLSLEARAVRPLRHFSAAAAPVKPRVPIQLTFPQIRKELSKPDTLLIDVREPDELLKQGRISPNAKNIPLGQLEGAFQLSAEEFQNKYGFPKPNSNATIVTHCRLGIRAAKGAIALSQAGFQNVIVYPGIEDWVENGGELLK